MKREVLTTEEIMAMEEALDAWFRSQEIDDETAISLMGFATTRRMEGLGLSPEGVRALFQVFVATLALSLNI